jgi:hypothetical protein
LLPVLPGSWAASCRINQRQFAGSAWNGVDWGWSAILTAAASHNQRARLTVTTGHGEAEASELRPSLL